MLYKCIQSNPQKMPEEREPPTVCSTFGIGAVLLPGDDVRATIEKSTEATKQASYVQCCQYVGYVGNPFYFDGVCGVPI